MTYTSRKKYYSATICDADGNEKIEFPALCGEALAQLVNVCVSQGFPVLVDAPVFKNDRSVIDEIIEGAEIEK